MTKNSGYFTLSRKIDEWEYLNQPLALALWIHLLRLAAWKDTEYLKRGEILTSAVELSKITGIDREIITRWLKAFESSGQIQTEKIGKFTKISLLNYEKYNPRRAEKSAGEPKSPAEISADTCGNIRTKTDDPSLLNINNETIKSMNKGITHIEKCDPPDVEIIDREEVWFREFWKEYPRHKAKAAAEKSFRKLCTGEKIFSEIMDGLKRSRERWERLGTEPRFIPYPSTWLNQERWEDEEDPEQRSSNPFLRSLIDDMQKGENNEYNGNEEDSEPSVFDISYWQ